MLHVNLHFKFNRLMAKTIYAMYMYQIAKTLHTMYMFFVCLSKLNVLVLKKRAE